MVTDQVFFPTGGITISPSDDLRIVPPHHQSGPVSPHGGWITTSATQCPSGLHLLKVGKIPGWIIKISTKVAHTEHTKWPKPGHHLHAAPDLGPLSSSCPMQPCSWANGGAGWARCYRWYLPHDFQVPDSWIYWRVAAWCHIFAEDML
jgi:hypothetical protein